MQYSEFLICGVRLRLSTFKPEGGVAEHHAMLRITDQSLLRNSKAQLDAMLEAEAYLFRQLIPDASLAMRRRFLDNPFGVEDAIGQKPLDGSAVAEWIYALDAEVKELDGMRMYESEGRRHIWQSASCLAFNDSGKETSALLESFEDKLSGMGGNIADHCVRTWFFVDDIDNKYAALVKARRENFLENGLTPQTHYIASTGICGKPMLEGALVQMDTYSVLAQPASKQVYLNAAANMNRTIEYGVTFERGVMLPYGDRKQVIISGTASIDNKGAVLHIGDVIGQTHRMLENVAMLLEEGDASFEDLNHIIVYLRNPEDYEKVAPLFEEKFPHTPYVIVHAPVCRPDWLIEMECMATVSSCDSAIKKF